MSWSALDWASKQKTGNGTNKLVLLCLANYADDKNTCFPSYKTLISITEMSRSTIIRALKSLEEVGLIEIEERFADFNEAKRQTSNLYTLKVGYQADTHPVQFETPPSITMKPHITNHNKPLKYEIEFVELWNEYPRKDGSKKKAHETWQKLTSEPNIVIIKKELFEKVKKYNKLNKNKELRFIPHLTTWLNQRRWETLDNQNEERINLNQLVG
jgi:DNA-binding transcriptional ArsR family regulator